MEDGRTELTLRRAVDCATDVIFVTKPDGTITFVNPAFEKLYGYTAKEAIGQTPRILKSGVQDKAFYDGLWSKLLAKQPHVRYRVVNKARDGRLVHVEASANVVVDGDGEVVGFVAVQRDITELKQFEQKLRTSEEARTASEARYRTLFDNLPIAALVLDLATMRYTDVNDFAARTYGYTREELCALGPADIRPPEDVAKFLEALHQPRSGIANYGPWRHKKKNGQLVDVEVVGQDISLDGRSHRIVYARDVTLTRQLEAQLRQSQKMEAAGRLASGVAHDFNNVLAVVLAYAESLLAATPAEAPEREDLEEIRKAARRGANLTQQLLLFSRKQAVQPRDVEVHELIGDSEKMLRRLAGEAVTLSVAPLAGARVVCIDPGALQQVLMNLVANARDACSDGGTVTIETTTVDVGECEGSAHGVTAGPFVVLRVIDTGAGMSADTQALIFEPFFTTKGPGKGTGLGLATVFGIVKQAGGFVQVESAIGRGSTFSVYLPLVDGSAVSTRSFTASAPERGSETILLVEDDEQLRAAAKTMLMRCGYRVVDATDPGDALLAAEQHAGPIHLLLTDVVLPRMNGIELAKRMARTRPGTRVLCMSGHSDGELLQRVLDANLPCVSKPFTAEQLASSVRDALGSPSAARSDAKPS